MTGGLIILNFGKFIFLPNSATVFELVAIVSFLAAVPAAVPAAVAKLASGVILPTMLRAKVLPKVPPF